MLPVSGVHWNPSRLLEAHQSLEGLPCATTAGSTSQLLGAASCESTLEPFTLVCSCGWEYKSADRHLRPQARTYTLKGSGVILGIGALISWSALVTCSISSAMGINYKVIIHTSWSSEWQSQPQKHTTAKGSNGPPQLGAPISWMIMIPGSPCKSNRTLLESDPWSYKLHLLPYTCGMAVSMIVGIAD